jgi:antitoxin (DNA-binding transcriptional repressor) of toxin-antitoxin stability system
MPRTLSLKETQAPYTLTLDEVTLAEETVIVEQEGRPVAAVVPIAEYEAFVAWRQRQEEAEEFWRKWEEWEREWAELPAWEQEGDWPDELTPEMIEARVQAVRESYGMIRVDDPDEALYIATSPELTLENIPLLLADAANLDKQL